ncbi:hypothetical protein OG21DRAFT_1491164 [Imleria badia]|nr:hypothetical protein OG21DRAFT_1491164 [Imleria badia]
MGSGGRIARSSGLIDAVEHLLGNATSPPNCIIGVMNSDAIGGKATGLSCHGAAIAQSRRAQYLPGTRRTRTRPVPIPSTRGLTGGWERDAP